MRAPRDPLLLALLITAASSTALAHPGPGAHVHPVLHPLLGLDHVAAMVAVGLLAIRLGGARFVLPLAFLSLMSVGAALGMAGVALPAVEPIVALSLLALGALLIVGRAVPRSAALVLVAGFALLHGAAHGAALGRQSGAGALVGVLVGTALLHGLGLGAGLLVARVAAGGALPLRARP